MGSVRWLVGALVLTLATLVQAASPTFTRDSSTLAAAPNRLTGSPALRAAQDYVTTRLREIGVDKVQVQQFPAAQLVTTRCTLTLKSRTGAARTLALLPVRPNGIIPPATPADGITGELLYAGKGRLEDYGSTAPRGKIVVLDFDAGAGWLRAFRLGAAAVIFTGAGEIDGQQAHYTEANANLPRYYYAGNPRDLMTATTATVHCTVRWQAAMGRNVVGMIRGTEPTFGLKAPEMVVLAAPLDTFGEVPELTPGARGAANAAALLQVAERLVAQRPRRDTLVVFLDAQAQGHAGAAAFYRLFDPGYAPQRIDSRAQSLKNERALLAGMVKCLAAAEQGTQAKSPHDRVFMQHLRDRAATHANQLISELGLLYKQQAALEHAGGEDEALTQVLAARARLEAEKNHWNDLRRSLAKNNLRQARTAAPNEFALIAGEEAAIVQTRQAELQSVATALASDQALYRLLKDRLVVLHASLLLGDTSPTWGLLLGGDSPFHHLGDDPGLYSGIQKTLLDTNKQLGMVPTFAAATVDNSLSTRLFWPAPLVHSGEIAGRVGVFNVALGTVQESLTREGTPADVLTALDLDRIEAQARDIARLLGAAANSDGLSQRGRIQVSTFYFFPEVAADGRIVGPTAKGQSAGSVVANTPLPGAVVQYYHLRSPNTPYKARKIPAFDSFQICIADGLSGYGFGPTPQDPNNTILRGFAAHFSPSGEVDAVSSVTAEMGIITRMELFNTYARDVVDGKIVAANHVGALVLTPQLDLVDTNVLQALSNGMLDKAQAHYNVYDGVAYWYTDKRVAGVKLFGIQSAVALVNGEERPGFAPGYQGWDAKTQDRAMQGTGLSLLERWQFPVTSLRSATDLWRVNERRLDVLRRRGVVNSSLEDLHASAFDLLQESVVASTTAKAETLAASSFLSQRQVYRSIRRSLDDLVHAVLILLALALPFAFALERLLIGSTNIYRQIGWFCAFFLATFGILYVVHPAFAISNQSVIIFLAFALLLLSCMVIYLIMQKFERELKVLQGLTSTVHNADVSRVSTMMAAVGMGISTMRRRPLRTALTALTITLLTFTILSFASFDTALGIVTLFSGASPRYSGTLVHRMNWGPLEPELYSMMQGRWGKEATVTARYWLPADTTDTISPLLTRADGSQATPLKGVLGLQDAEVTHRRDLRALFGSTQLRGTVYLSQTLAGSLGISIGDTVLLKGQRLQVAGLFTASQVASIKDMDDSEILPVDFSAMTSSQSAQPAQLQQQAQMRDDAALASAQNQQEWVPLPADMVAIVSAETAQRMGASLRVVTLYTPDSEAAVSIAEALARMLPMPVIATREDATYTHVLAPVVAAKGVKDLIFPILLGGLVIFGTMLGSVADREKEIYTFSALGLAPAHVATLFFAEAMVYACIGGLGGYLLAQGVMKTLMALATVMPVTVPEVNYSSTNAIVTILIVMATVLVSALYPAYKASHSANPGILRSWKPPKAVGDSMDIVFPFTVSQYDITGVLSFLKEHFANFADTSLGVFMARNPRVEMREDGNLMLCAFLALAPFDLGVTQEFALYSTPSEIEGIDEVKIELHRLSGQQNDWERLNKVLLDELRKQFLIWRALPAETMEHYRQQTLQTMGDAQPETTPATAPASAPELV